MKIYQRIFLPWKEMQLYPNNPRETSPKDKADIRNSLRRWGLADYQTAWMPHKIILGGNQRQLALYELEKEGEKIPEKLPYIPFEGTGDEAAMLNLALNKIGGRFDAAKLAVMFADLAARVDVPTLTRTGFDTYEIDALASQTLERAEKVLAAGHNIFDLISNRRSVAEVRAALVRGGMDLQSADILAPIYVAAEEAPDWEARQKKSVDDDEPESDGLYLIKVQIAPDVNLQWKKMLAAAPGKGDEEKFASLLSRAEEKLGAVSS